MLRNNSTSFINILFFIFFKPQKEIILKLRCHTNMTNSKYVDRATTKLEKTIDLNRKSTQISYAI